MSSGGRLRQPSGLSFGSTYARPKRKDLGVEVSRMSRPKTRAKSAKASGTSASNLLPREGVTIESFPHACMADDTVRVDMACQKRSPRHHIRAARAYPDCCSPSLNRVIQQCGRLNGGCCTCTVLRVTRDSDDLSLSVRCTRDACGADAMHCHCTDSTAPCGI